MAVEDIIETRAPEVFEAQEDRLEGLIALAEPYLRPVPAEYSGLRDQGLAFLVLHWLAKEGREGSVGSVIEEKEGELTLKYSAPASGSDADYSTTTWGAEFLGMRRRLALLPFPEVEQ